MDINTTQGQLPAVVLRRETLGDLPKPVSEAAGAGRGEASKDPLVEREPVEQAVSSIQQFVQNIQRDLNFSLDDSSGNVVVKVTDGTSGEVIRQIPSEEALQLAESLDQMRSLLFKAEA